MNRLFTLFMCVSVLFSCKKDKDADKTAEPAPVQTGTIALTVLAYDSLGDPESNSGINISLYKTDFTGVTNTAGQVSFTGVPYGDVLPVIQKTNYEGAPLRVTLNSSNASATVPCAKYCAYRTQNLTGNGVDADSITLSFKIDRAIPTGKVCKMAILYSDATIDATNFLAADTIKITTQNVSKLNVARLPNLKNALASLTSNKTFNIVAVPVSYGIYYSNIFGKNILLGENPYLSDNLIFSKTW